MAKKVQTIAQRFRGMLPIVVDVETSGVNPQTDALLEIAVIGLAADKEGRLYREQTVAYHVEPFLGAHLDKEALEITGIDPYSPLRYAIPESQVVHRIFSHIKILLEKTHCHRAVLVGHNAWFDLSFLQAAAKRSHIVHSPFHTFTTLDTATLAAAALGETVLARAVRRLHIPFDVEQAHSAIYDAEKTAELFCHIINHWGRQH
ncbi:MAG: ribonuclease T [Gammaproteobacteria bacterium RIFCSPHIGHO2_12_FULL_41_20]|nr:MAG: ribonuclease T [Gammaproteobacteria bacterium RIFCSPHIGHO2_12_FULL_41_20]